MAGVSPRQRDRDIFERARKAADEAQRDIQSITFISPSHLDSQQLWQRHREMQAMVHAFAKVIFPCVRTQPCYSPALSVEPIAERASQDVHAQRLRRCGPSTT